MSRPVATVALLLSQLVACSASADEELVGAAKEAMEKAGDYYASHVATHGGYVYFYSLDLAQRWGEGVATPDQIWVQPPGTPTVGLAFLSAYEATGAALFLEAGTNAAHALAYGQLKSGGWTNCIDFDPNGKRVAAYRNGRGQGKNNSSLDDGQTSAAIQLMVHADHANRFQDKLVHRSARTAIAALLDAQFSCGGFPQVWVGPVSPHPIRQANYPKYDWRTEGRIKDYWNRYTINDNVCGFVAQALIDADEVYSDPKLNQSLRKLGDFLIAAQMPEPQPAWAQQYNYAMQPIWARRFEPPAIAGNESQEVIETLMLIAVATEDARYLKPIPRALEYLERSLLPNGQLARYYELRTNRPLYMSRRGSTYSLTYSDADLPRHYGWKWDSKVDSLRRRYQSLRYRLAPLPKSRIAREQVRQLIADLDGQGRWVSTYGGERLVGQAKMVVGSKYLSSQVFADNMVTLARFVIESQ